MKTSIYLPAGIAVLIAGLCFGRPLLAQEQEGQKPQARAGTKIFMVNLREVYEQYYRVQEFNRQLEKELPQFKKARTLRGDDGYGTGFRYFPGPIQRAELAKLRAEVEEIIDEKYAGKRAAIEKDIKEVIDAIAKAYGFQVVLVYGEPDILASGAFWIPEELRDRDATSGGLIPVYIHRNVDITRATIDSLNSARLRKSPMKKDHDQ